MAFPERVETDRLLLRRLGEEDADAWAAIWSDPEVRSLRPDGSIDDGFALARLHHHVEHWRRHGFGLWVAEERASGEVVGWAGPSHPTFVPELAEEIEVGWTLLRAYRGRGLATEGAGIALRAAFGHLAPARVISLIHPLNEASTAVARRLGMSHERDVLHPGIGEDLRVYAVTRGGGAATAGGPGARRAS